MLYEKKSGFASGFHKDPDPGTGSKLDTNMVDIQERLWRYSADWPGISGETDDDPAGRIHHMDVIPRRLKHPNMPSSGGVFSCLQQRARSTLVGKHRPDVIVRRLEHGPKFVSVSALKAAFGAAELFLREEETDCIVERFADNRRRIAWRRLLAALDVAPPPDFTDPDRSFLDSLPQPYRLIVSVLETEIVDRAWTQIVVRHPELDTSTADEARLAADIDLKRSCPPCTWLYNPHSPLPRPNCNECTPAPAPGEKEDRDGLGVSKAAGGRPDVQEHADDGVSGSEEANSQAGGVDGVTAVQWDQRGELLFTGGRDGSVCLRIAGALNNVAGQVGVFVQGTSAAVTCFSRAVSVHTDTSDRPVPIRIAAAATAPSCDKGDDSSRRQGEEEEVPIDGSRDAVGESTDKISSPRSRVSVLEVSTTSDIFSDEDSSVAERSMNYMNASSPLRVIYFADLPEAVVSCALSSDGNRLAASLSGGRVVVWVLPPLLPLSKQHPSSDPVDDNEMNSTKDKHATGEGVINGTGGASFDGDSSLTVSGGKAPPAEVERPPARLPQPEFCIPHLQSPEERVYEKALQEYRKRLEAGDIPCAAATDDAGEQLPGSIFPPAPPAHTPLAHHVAHVDFISTTSARGAAGGVENISEMTGGGMAGIAVWRSLSNVWRRYRLPDCPTESSSKPIEDAEIPGVPDGSTTDGADPSLSVQDPLTPSFDVSSLPSVEWLLPSPITASALCDSTDDPASRYYFEDVGIGKEGRQRNEENAGLRPVDPNVFPPLVAIGTENGGVYVCDAVVGLRREGLSRHRARVTTLAFHGRRFLFSGSDDEMVHIHDISSRSCTQLRCLHDARGYGIVRVDCLQETPLAFAEDASGRIVAYDLVFGSMLGVLALGDSLSTGDDTKGEDRPIHGKSDNGQDTRKKAGVAWTSGGDCLAVVTPTEDTPDDFSTTPALGGPLGVWSAADVMWGLSPGVRSTAGHERPVAAADLAKLFYELGPAKRKGIESHARTSSPASKDVMHYSSRARSPLLQTPTSLPTGSRRATPPNIPSNAQHRSTRSRAYLASNGSEAGCGRIVRDSEPRLTEGNISRRQVRDRAATAPGSTIGGWMNGCFEKEGVGGRGAGLGARDESVAVERVRRYLETRHGERAARQARLSDVTRNLLQAL